MRQTLPVMKGESVRTDEDLLVVSDLSVAFPTADGLALAVQNVDLSVAPGRTLGVVGESGSGKSVSLRALLGLVPAPGAVIGGRITWRGQDLVASDSAQFQRIRGTQIGMIFQDPAASLHPLYSIGDQLAETLRANLGRTRRQARAEAIELLGRVGIATPARRARDYPHQLSGGMRQRVMIALALASQPALLLADEPTTALDVTIQDQILALLVGLQQETGMAMIFVSHDLGVIAQMSDDIAVMYAGRVVEAGTRDDVIHRPAHPYTRALLLAAPTLDANTRVPIAGQPPALSDARPGCSFAPRCELATEVCGSVLMELTELVPHHLSACPFDDDGGRRRAE